MEKNSNEKIYRYGEKYYSFFEIYALYQKSNYDSKKEVKDCICNYILAEILKKGGLINEGNALDTLASYRVKHSGKIKNKSEKFLYDNSIFFLGFKILGLAAIKNSYKVSELTSGEWILNKLVSLTLGSNYPINQIDDFILIDYSLLSVEECTIISENFMRNVWNKELEQYKFTKSYTKK